MKLQRTLLGAGFVASLTLAFAFAPASSAPFASAPAIAADVYDIDTGHSTVLFRVKHLNTSYSYGRFNAFTGEFSFDSANPENSKVRVEVKTESLDSADAKRDGHLRSPDFFDTKQFPTATFESKSVKKGRDGRIVVAGDFTLRGVTKPVTIDVEMVGTTKDERFGERAGFHGTFTIKRSEFGVSYMPGGLGEDVLVTVSLEGVKKAAK